MKKSLLFASMGLLSLSALAQGVDPATYADKEGFALKNKWIMSVGNGENGPAINDWKALTELMGNPGKATSAARLGDYVYISCSQDNGLNEAGEAIVNDDAHLLVLDAETGKFVKDLKLTLNGEAYTGLIHANCIGSDDFGHLWLTPYVSCTYKVDEATGVATVKPIPLYEINTETGELILINNFELDDFEGPEGGGRIDFCAVTGDITRKEARCSFMAVPNEVAVLCAWHSEQGEEEWDIDLTSDAEYCVIKPEDTYPKEQTAWNYSPMASFVTDDEYSGTMFYVDGHPTQPVLYDNTGEMIDNLSIHTPAKDATADEDPWVGYMPSQQPNGVRQFAVAGQQFLAYALAFPDGNNQGGEIAIIKLDENDGIENATPMWIAPANHLGVLKGEGRFYHSIWVTPEMTDANGKKYVEILLYKDVNGVAIYQLGEEGFVTGIADAVAEIAAEGPVKFYNLNGVEVNENNITAGVYVTLQGGVAKKVVIK